MKLGLFLHVHLLGLPFKQPRSSFASGLGPVVFFQVTSYVLPRWPESILDFQLDCDCHQSHLLNANCSGVSVAHIHANNLLTTEAHSQQLVQYFKRSKEQKKCYEHYSFFKIVILMSDCHTTVGIAQMKLIILPVPKNALFHLSVSESYM